MGQAVESGKAESSHECVLFVGAAPLSAPLLRGEPGWLRC